MTLQEAIEEVKRYREVVGIPDLDERDIVNSNEYIGYTAIATILNAVVKGQLTCK